MSELTDRLYDAVLSHDTDAEASIRAQLAALSEPRYYQGLPATIDPVYTSVLTSDTNGPMDVLEWMTKTYSKEWTSWEHETIRMKLWQDFGLALDEVRLDRIWALKAAIISTTGFEDWYAFNQLCLGLCGSQADFVVLRNAEPGMVVFTATFLAMLHPESKFEEEVTKFMCATFITNGINCPPPSLFEIVENVMRWMTSRAMQLNWHDIYLRYNEMTPDTVPEETVVDIQAKRVYDAEYAAIGYAGEI